MALIEQSVSCRRRTYCASSTMLSASALLLILLPLLLLPISTVHAKEACDGEQFAQTPCRCCKMDCWYSVAGSAAHELGHMPGQAGEQEALATLRLIRACMIAECTPLCAPLVKKKRRQWS